jgi:SAM-dependent methyltransferase
VTLFERIGHGYAQQRRPDARIEARIHDALGGAVRVLNVGAGTGSYEPPGAVALEPSPTMVAQRGSPNPCVRGVAGALPFRSSSFDAVLAIMTVHHWPDRVLGLRELQRVADRQVIVTFDWAVHDAMWWVSEYLADIARDWEHNTSAEEIVEVLGGGTIETVEVPWDTTDGLLVAYWRQPERYLDPAVRASASGTALADPALVDAAVARLRADLASGDWHQRHADLLERDTLDVGLRVVTCARSPSANDP